ncbi:polysaccharide pyruvyl transferase family protein [Vibrio ordalii]|uniref:polysaccharide pyruvyl transferase family protein n=1 Tax=Vibrio ordalii TaxID=28174 RepID=UPI002575C24E|nr:polysaccharide pyruvyl transferase family protein [Vibrio ordalii]MCS0350759.1 polysaccharide pyruvyl transferase family protein [Vibrio ordalii]
MKIAIMTQPLGHNYGGILQAWALQQILKKEGHQVVTIDRQPENRGVIYNGIRFSVRVVKKITGKRNIPINFEKHYPYIFGNTKKFVSDNIVTSESLDRTKNLKAHFERGSYDAVIVGSDQTWRPRYSPNIANFFLDFLEGINLKKISYASSFGVDEWEFNKIETKLCANLAKKFDAISVREDSGISLCKRFLGVQAEHVLDPTLLLNKSFYEELIGKDRIKVNNEGIFTYFLDKTPGKVKLVERASKETGESVYSCQAKYSLNANIKAHIDDYTLPDPREWLSGFANSNYVITDSFHGMVFSIIFNKPFYVVNNKSRGAARFHSLLRKLNIEQFLIDENYNGDMFSSDNLINFNDVNCLLDKLSNSSFRFIYNNL